jgi:predicted CoA-binding protein
MKIVKNNLDRLILLTDSSINKINDQLDNRTAKISFRVLPLNGAAEEKRLTRLVSKCTKVIKKELEIVNLFGNVEVVLKEILPIIIKEINKDHPIF